MTKVTKIVLGVVGTLCLLFVVTAAGCFYMVRSAFQTEPASAEQAGRAFDEIRARFPGVSPAFGFDDAGPRLLREPPATAPATLPTRVHILAYDIDEGNLARIHLPMWFLKRTNAPIEFQDVKLRIEDVERYGSTVLLDGDAPDGNKLLIWSD